MFGFAKWTFSVLAVFAFIRILQVGFSFSRLNQPYLDYVRDLVGAMIAFSVIAAIALAMWWAQ